MEEKKKIDYSTDFLKEYIEPKRSGSKFWRRGFIVFMLIVFLILIMNELFKIRISPKELKASLEFYNIHSQWIVKEKVKTKDFEGILLVPQVTFSVRNTGKNKLENLYFIGVFSFMDIANVSGEGYQAILGDPIKPLKSTKKIILTSSRGYRATSVRAFKKNKGNWKRSMVKIYARNKNLKLTYIKTFYISRKIAGDDIDIKLIEKKRR